MEFSRNFVPCGYVGKPVVDTTEWEFLVTFISEPSLNLFGGFEFAISQDLLKGVYVLWLQRWFSSLIVTFQQCINTTVLVASKRICSYG